MIRKKIIKKEIIKEKKKVKVKTKYQIALKWKKQKIT